ncbi:MAG: hypothetical protein CL607_14250 [Anaerolineaceae bacterium]|nr:hypothetical protein [Anaerolineaceae bacterium]
MQNSDQHDIDNNEINLDREHDNEVVERTPQFVTSERGRVVSIAGLTERIIEEFHIEFDDDSLALQESDTQTKRRGLLRDVADYVIGIESVQLSLPDKAQILQKAYSEIFGYGPLDAYFADPAVTTISLENKQGISVRFGPASDLVVQEEKDLFDDWHHVRRTIKRLLKDADAEIRSDIPIVEAGLTINNRRVSVNVVSPPYSTDVMADIRVHPADPIQLDTWVQQGMMTDLAADFLRRLAKSSYGFAIVGDTESGKSTLMSSILAETSLGEGLRSVEWSGELILPNGAVASKVQWPVGDDEGVTFSERVMEVLDAQPAAIVLDEVRADEAGAIAPLLAHQGQLRQMWVIRGASESKRIRSAISMLARRADSDHSESMVKNLYEKLPFVIVLKRRRDRLELLEIAEWQPAEDGSGYYDYVPLIAKGWEGLERTSNALEHEL